MPHLAILGAKPTTLLTAVPYLKEKELQDRLQERPELIALDDVDPAATALIPIGYEVGLAGQWLDLLFLDLAGRLVAVEAKLHRNPEIRREVVGQIIEYAARLSRWDGAEVERQANAYFAGTHAPEHLRNKTFEEAVNTMTPDDAIVDVGELRRRIVRALAVRDMRLVIAVDRVVDSLRESVLYMNHSDLRVFLLEVQQYQLPEGTQVAAISVFGGRPASSASGVAWDEARFLKLLRTHGSAAAITVVEDLFEFMQLHADQVKWGAGDLTGKAGFGGRYPNRGLRLFWVTTDGNIEVNSGPFVRAGLGEKLQGLVDAVGPSNVRAPDTLKTADETLTFDAGLLLPNGGVERFKKAVRELDEELRRS